MKKLVLVSLIAALAAAPAFAEIEFSAWGRGMFSPLIFWTDYNDLDHDGDGWTSESVDDTAGTGAGAGVTWAPSFATEFVISGGTDYVGFGIGMDIDGGGASFGLNSFGAHIWAQPLGSDLLRFTAGRFRDDTLRGRQGVIGNGFEYFVLPDTLRYSENDAIFHRFNQRGGFFPGSPAQGFMVSSRPMEPLFIGLGVTAPLAGMGEEGWVWTPFYAGWVFRTTQIGFGFDLEGIGTVRAQFLGGFMNVDFDCDCDSPWGSRCAAGHLMHIGMNLLDDDEDIDDLDPSRHAAGLAPRIELAFAYTAMEGLLIDFGFKFHLPVTIENMAGPDSELVVREGIFIALGANFEQDAFRLRARLELDAARGTDSTIGGGDTAEWRDGLGLSLRLAPAFNLGFGWAGLHIGMNMRGESSFDGDGNEDNTFRLGFGGFFERDLGGNGIFKTGLTYTLPTSVNGNATGSGVFSIPVLMEFWF